MKIHFTDNRGKKLTGTATVREDGFIDVDPIPGLDKDETGTLEHHMVMQINDERIYTQMAWVDTWWNDEVNDARWFLWRLAPTTKADQVVMAQLRHPYQQHFTDADSEIDRIKLDTGRYAYRDERDGRWYVVWEEDGESLNTKLGNTFDLLSKGIKFRAAPTLDTLPKYRPRHDPR